MKPLLVLAGLASVALASAQDTLNPSDPTVHRIIGVLRQLVCKKIFIAYVPCRLYDSNRTSRYEAAVAVHTATMRTQELLKQAIDPTETPEERNQAAQTLAGAAGPLLQLDWAATQFERELDSLGVDVPTFHQQVLAQAAEINRRYGFQDTIATHWAAGATIELRALGILTGYPDGVYVKPLVQTP